LTFPTFSLTIDDSTNCLLAYEIINLKGFDTLKCDYMQNEPDMIKNLAITETRRSDDKRKLRSPHHQQIQHELQREHGSAWKVEIRASYRRQQEQTTQKAAAEEHVKKARLEISHVWRKKPNIVKEQAHESCPEAPMTEEEKWNTIKSLIHSFETHPETIDYKLVRDLENRFP
jgi:hypothetical protein